MSFETIIVEKRGRVGLITLARPNALNALNSQLMREVVAASSELDQDDGVGCLLVAGSEKAFAAGADIKEMQSRSFVDIHRDDWLSEWEKFADVRKPLIAAVDGFALGGGCELAMMCDIVIAAETAKFGQPEIKLGVMPGMGGTQRLVRLVGRAKAMDMCLTGRMIDAIEAERIGLVSRVVPRSELLQTSFELAGVVASMSLPSLLMIKESIKRAEEGSLHEGLRFERRLFHSLFSTNDQKEGMAAFVEKRAPLFSHK